MWERQSCLYSRILTLPRPPPKKKNKKTQTKTNPTTNKISTKLVTDINSQVCVLHKHFK